MSERLEFIDAPDRGYISRLGRHPDARIQLSVNPRGIRPEVDLDSVPLSNARAELSHMWDTLRQNRQSMEGHFTLASQEYGNVFPILNAAVFAPTTEQLFNDTLTVAIRNHCRETGRSLMAVSEVGYLLPLWAKDKLRPIGVVEGELYRYIKEGKTLPDTIGAVYLDFPSNQQRADAYYDINQLIRFIRINQSVLFIIDQANLYFLNANNNLNDLMFTRNKESGQTEETRLMDDDLVIVTDTTSKTLGMSGCCTAAATKRARKLLEKQLGSDLPVALGFDEQSFMQARKALYFEAKTLLVEGGDKNILEAYRFRQVILRNKARLISSLNSLFDESTTCPELKVNGARIIINAQALKRGFDNAEDLCEALYRRFSIDTKPASVYASPRVSEEWDKYVQMTIPCGDEEMNAVLNAFKVLSEQP